MKRLIILAGVFLLLLAPMITVPAKAAPDCFFACEMYVSGVYGGCMAAGGDAFSCYVLAEWAGCRCRNNCDAALPACN